MGAPERTDVRFLLASLIRKWAADYDYVAYRTAARDDPQHTYRHFAYHEAPNIKDQYDDLLRDVRGLLNAGDRAPGATQATSHHAGNRAALPAA